MIQPVAYQIKPKSTVVKVKREGTGFKNDWVKHVQAYAKQHNLSYWDAMKKPECKSSYKK